ncbi:hypothetical protein JCM10207_000492 [Rhodosporidiobolus poonsookiae]
MARFGLQDSDSESDTGSTSTHRDQRTSSAPLSDNEGEASLIDSHAPSFAQDDDDDDYEAPPRSSLMQDDDDSLSGSEDEDDDADLMADDTFVDKQPPRLRASTRRTPAAAATRDTRSPSTFSRASSLSHSHSHSHRTLSRQPSSPGSRTPSPPPPSGSVKRLALSASSTAQHQRPWASKLKLDPSRIAVMQASFFHQPGDDALEATGGEGAVEDERERERERREDEREQKRRAVEKGFASRAAPPPAAAPAPVPVPILDPAPFRSFRAYERVPLASSVTSGKESSLVDAGLALGRSYRVGWGPGGEMVSLKGWYDVKGARSDVLKVEKLSLLADDDPSPALRLLKLQLSQTEIFEPSPLSLSSSPAAVPSPSLRFSHFADLFSSPSAAQPSSASSSTRTDEAQLFKLGAILFDEIPDLALPAPGDDAEHAAETQTPAYRAALAALRRKDQLSAWLEQAVASEVEADLRAAAASSGSGSSATTTAAAKRIFAHLSGHQLSSACDAALSTRNLRLATLLPQAGSLSAPADPSFSADLFLQLSKWREYRVDAAAHFPTALRRVYEVLCGNLGVSAGRTGGVEDQADEVHVLEGLGWTRALAMWAWYGAAAPSSEGATGAEERVRAALEAYEGAVAADQRVAAPLPAWVRAAGAAAKTSADGQDGRDPAYHLLKLFAEPAHPLEALVLPVNFGPSRGDYRMPWHLYVLLSRVLRQRDFEDRVDVELEQGGMKEDGAEVEGNSVTADRVTESYAAQLEQQGLWEWSAFVLLHLELEAQRTAALRALLSRHVDELARDGENGEKFKFLTDTLKIPAVWIWSAQADRALSSPSRLFESYTLLLRALRPAEAHRIAVDELVPEALVRGDVGLVRRLLEPFVMDEDDGGEGLRGTVEGWEEGGKVYLLYLSLLATSTTALSLSVPAPAPLLAQTIAAVQAFSQRVHATPRTRGNLKLRLAVGEMVSRCGVLAKAQAQAQGAVGASTLDRLQPSLLPSSDRCVWIQGANKALWETSLAKAGAAA